MRAQRVERTMHHDSTKSVSVTAHGQARECKLPSAPGEVPVDVFSDRGSIPLGSTIVNDPTQSEQIVVSCSDWVGSFFACSPCVSGATGFFTLDAMCHWAMANSSKSESKTCK